MTDLVIARTADLPPAVLAASRALLFDVFDDMAEDDWQHCLGGTHAIVVDGDDVIGHASVVERRLTHDGRELRAGYVEGVGVRPDRRGEGHGAAVMAPLEELVRTSFEVGALGSTDEALSFYAARGWQAWRGPLTAQTPDGIIATPDEEGGVLVLAASAELDLDGGLRCDWREGDVW